MRRAGPILDDRVRVRLGYLSRQLGDANWLDGEFTAGDLLMVSVLRRPSSFTVIYWTTTPTFAPTSPVVKRGPPTNVPPHEEVEWLFRGYGYTPHFVEGSDPETMHQQMAATLETCVLEIRAIQANARRAGTFERPRWPMIILRSPKGWTGPKQVNGHKVEDFWRAHQVPILDPVTNPASLKLLESWMRSYRPEELFDSAGKLIPELRSLAPSGDRRISANPHANGGLLRKPLDLPRFQDYAVAVKAPAGDYVSPTATLATFLRDVMKRNMTSFRVFGPDETASNKLDGIYAASKKTWVAKIESEDADGTEIAPDGRVMEMLSEHTLEGWFEGYVLTGRHGFFSTYESFVQVIDSMFNQHAKWLEKSKMELGWRAPISSINLLITSLVWRQDHNGFTHQDPGFLDVVTNKSPDVVRIYMPPDANCLLSVADHCLRSKDYYNVIVADKQPHLTFLDKTPRSSTARKASASGIGRALTPAPSRRSSWLARATSPQWRRLPRPRS